ncbi:MAG: ATP-binding protein [Ginsengibacter sp.]
MSVEPFIIFFLARYIRKNLRTFSQDDWWDKVLTYTLYATGLIFILELISSLDNYIIWVWHVALLAIVYIVFTVPRFTNQRPIIVAVLPLIVISIVKDVLENAVPNFFATIETYLDIAFAIAITWMISMLIKSNKQNKALERERKRAQEETERAMFIEGQRAQLEQIVAQRTAEITHQKDELQNTLTELKTTQTQLIHSEKMASLGELTAGIAHEIQNPLNFVNNFSEVNFELIEEMTAELLNGNTQEAVSIAKSIKENEQKIIHHGKRADAIVKGMLQHSRSSNGMKELTDINALADEYLRLSYHGLRAKDKSFNAIMETHFDETLEKIKVIPQDVGRAFLNLFTNAFYAVAEKRKTAVADYNPKVIITTKKYRNGVEVKVRDNGLGIPEKALEKIFQPFFTTKPSGEGTGLGLSLSYEIITQGHGGDIQVDTQEGEFAEFTIQIPGN